MHRQKRMHTETDRQTDRQAHSQTETHQHIPEIVADGCRLLPGPSHMPVEGGATDAT